MKKIAEQSLWKFLKYLCGFLAEIQRANGNIQMQQTALKKNSVGATLLRQLWTVLKKWFAYYWSVSQLNVWPFLKTTEAFKKDIIQQQQ